MTESKQNKEKKSWNDIHFLGDELSGTWADFLQSAEMRDAHGETCDVSQYINEDSVIFALGNAGFADLAPGVMASLGILGTFLGLVMGLSGLSLNGADTEVVLKAMDELVRGMSTAFLTSIIGVWSSLLFNLLNNRATSKCQKAIDRFCGSIRTVRDAQASSEDTAMLATSSGTDGVYPSGGRGHEPKNGGADGAEHHARHAARAAFDG
ncbi:MAG: MotA/TolQ/ExbB proton channel family protein [Christensenellales bacterium]